MILGALGGSDVILDRMLVDDVAIGSNPTAASAPSAPLESTLVDPFKSARISIADQLNGRVTLRIEGPPGAIYAIEASDNLKSWAPIGFVQDPTGTNVFTDIPAAIHNQWFYRITAQP